MTAAETLFENGKLSEVDYVSACATTRIPGLKLATLKGLMVTVRQRMKSNSPDPTDCILVSGLHLDMNEYEILEAFVKRVRSTYKYRAPMMRRS